LLRHIVWWLETSVSDECAASIFKPTKPRITVKTSNLAAVVKLSKLEPF